MAITVSWDKNLIEHWKIVLDAAGTRPVLLTSVRGPFLLNGRYPSPALETNPFHKDVDGLQLLALNSQLQVDD